MQHLPRGALHLNQHTALNEALSLVSPAYAYSVFPCSSWNIHYLQPSAQLSKKFSKQKPAHFTVKAERYMLVGGFQVSSLRMFSSVRVLSWDNPILLALHQSSSPNWNMIARTLIRWKTVHLEWWIISSCLPVPTHTKRMCQPYFGFTESGFTTLVSKESTKLKAHSLKYSLNSFQALSCPVMLWIVLFHNPSKQNRTIHPLICQNIHMSWWQISIMEEIRAFTWCLKKKCSNGVTSVDNLFWTNICAHQETKHPFCFSATHYKQQKMKHLCEFKNTTNSFLSPDVCKLSAAMSHIHWAKPLITVKNETNGTTEKSLDWRGGDWPFHHALSERGVLLICEEAEQKTRFSWFLGQRSCSTVCISTLHSE